MVSHGSNPVSLLWALMIFLPGFVVVPSVTAAQTVVTNTTVVEQAAADKSDGNDTTQQTESIRQQKRKKITVGFYVVWGILFLGLACIFITMMMGRTLRRIARKPAPQSTVRNELWYMKPDKNRKSTDSEENTSSTE